VARPLLEVANLRVCFPTSDGIGTAVRRLSFEVETGQTLGREGESGSGKSVSALAIMGLVRNAQVSRRALKVAQR